MASAKHVKIDPEQCYVAAIERHIAVAGCCILSVKRKTLSRAC